ncbi:MAG: SRPBCC family protein [Actinomycetota bacterium]|nr:SRPBCC family protein [Actinomycetota bacterium]
MATIRNAVVIRRPRHDVFAALSNPRSELEWNPKVQLMERIDDGPLGVGSKFRAKWKLSKPLTLEITRYDAPNGWSYTNDGPIEVDLDIDLVDHPDGTELRSRFSPRAKGSARLMFPFFLMAIRREERQNLQHLKRWLEAPRSTS